MITMMKIVRRLKTHLSTSSEFATCGKVARQADWLCSQVPVTHWSGGKS